MSQVFCRVIKRHGEDLNEKGGDTFVNVWLLSVQAFGHRLVGMRLYAQRLLDC